MSVEASIGFPLRKVKGQMTGFLDCSDEDSLISRKMDPEASHDELCSTGLDHTELDNSDQQETADMGNVNGATRPPLSHTTSIKIPMRRTVLGASTAGYALEPGPIFNYARVWNHLRTAEYVGNAFCASNSNLKAKRSLQGKAWVEDPHRWKENLEGWHAGTTNVDGICPDASAVDETNLTGTSLNQGISHEVTPEEMERYVFSGFNFESADITQNFIVATVVALALQWGTTGSAIVIAYQSVLFSSIYLH